MFGLTQEEKNQRDLAIKYKKVFRGSKEGGDVYMDLMNRFHVLRPINYQTERENAVAEGKRQAVLYILERADINIEEFDKMLKGDL